MYPEKCIEAFIYEARRNPNNNISGFARRQILTSGFLDNDNFSNDLFVALFAQGGRQDERDLVVFWGDRSLISSVDTSSLNAIGENCNGTVEEVDSIRREDRLLAVLHIQPGSNAEVYYAAELSQKSAEIRLKHAVVQ